MTIKVSMIVKASPGNKGDAFKIRVLKRRKAKKKANSSKKKNRGGKK